MSTGTTSVAVVTPSSAVPVQNLPPWLSHWLRNAYQGGDIALPPGWVPNNRLNTVRMPGWYDVGRTAWFEDESQVSTTTGNVSDAKTALELVAAEPGGLEIL